MRASELESKHLERLLAAGAHVNAVDRLGRSALHYAAKSGSDGNRAYSYIYLISFWFVVDVSWLMV
jgi:ankyrin repeat protein